MMRATIDERSVRGTASAASSNTHSRIKRPMLTQPFPFSLFEFGAVTIVNAFERIASLLADLFIHMILRNLKPRKT